MIHRAKTVTRSTMAIGIAVLVVGAIALSDPIAEWWYLRQVKLGDPEAKKPAARKLGALGSVRAIPALLEMAGEDFVRQVPMVAADLDGDGDLDLVTIKPISGDFDGDGFLDLVVSGTASPDLTLFLTEPGRRIPNDTTFQALLQILAKRKQEALRALLTGLEHPKPQVRYVAALTLAEVEPAAKETVRGLFHALEAETVAWVRASLEAALRKLRPKL